jgi:hypothetical protein
MLKQPLRWCLSSALLSLLVSATPVPLQAEMMRMAQADAAPETITLPNKPPERSADRDPSATALLETWLAGYAWDEDKRFDTERYEIISRRVTWKPFGRALLQFRVLPLDGDAMALAAERCPGRNRPIEAQIYFQWTEEYGLWTALGGRGDPASETCPDDELWTADQVEKIVNPPPLPVPPKISAQDVVTPAPGSPERKAILDDVRPAFEKLFGAPIEFQVKTLRVADGFAWATLHPQRPDGEPISEKDWKAAVGECEQNRKTAAAQLWLRQRNGQWTIGWGGPTGVCATDSIADLGYLIGAPPQLVGKDKWDDTEFMPIEDPQYFDLWGP